MAKKLDLFKVNRAQAGLRWWLAKEVAAALEWKLDPSEAKASRRDYSGPSSTFVMCAVTIAGQQDKLPSEKRDRAIAAATAFTWLEELAGRLDKSRGVLGAIAAPDARRLPGLAAFIAAGPARERTANRLGTARRVLFDVMHPGGRKRNDFVDALRPYVKAGRGLYAPAFDLPYTPEEQAWADEALAQLRPALLVARRLRRHTVGVRLLELPSRVGTDLDNWTLAPFDLLLRAAGLIDLVSAIVGSPMRAYPAASEVELDGQGLELVLQDVTLVLHDAGFRNRQIWNMVEDGTKPSSKAATVSRRLRRAIERRDFLTD